MSKLKVVPAEHSEVARPLPVLVPLIHEELGAGDKAGIEHYRRAGEMLLEAKVQISRGEWTGWVKRNFKLSAKSATSYMRLAEQTQIGRARPISSVREALGQKGGGKVSWQRPVQAIAERVNVAGLARDQQDRAREQKMIHALAWQCIDIGYKVLASKLHPDKGGSNEAMARLNKVRKLLKGAV